MNGLFFRNFTSRDAAVASSVVASDPVCRNQFEQLSRLQDSQENLLEGSSDCFRSWKQWRLIFVAGAKLPAIVPPMLGNDYQQSFCLGDPEATKGLDHRFW
jgi:hypothetical protein